MFKKLFLGNTQVDFYKLGNIFYKVFLLEFVIFLTVLLLTFTGMLSLNLSVDFTGGTTYQFDSNYTTSDIQELINIHLT